MSLRDASDATLVVAIGRWRQDALAEAYRRHAGAAFALARRLLADRDLAEEVLQEVFLRLWNAPDRFDPERGSLRSYLLAQTHGRSVDLLRSETSRRRREEREARETAEHGVNIEREVIDHSVAEQVKQVVADLPADEARRRTRASLGKMPTTLVRRLISSSTRSSGFVDQIFFQWAWGRRRRRTGRRRASRSISSTAGNCRPSLEAMASSRSALGAHPPCRRHERSRKRLSSCLAERCLRQVGGPRPPAW